MHVRMDPAYCIILCTWFTIWTRMQAQAAALPEFSGEVSSSAEHPEFQKFLINSRRLTDKIQKEIKVIQRSLVHSQYEEEKLAFMEVRLQIPKVHLKECMSRAFHLETCLGRAKAGLQMFLDHLPIVQKQSSETQEVETLKADLRDLLNAFSQQVTIHSLPQIEYPHQPVPTFSNQFDEQIGTHIILNYMTRFMNDMYRSLRSLIRS
ncbi:myelomonocytic growth factor-like isoform X1 [Polypterus senegalus]|uniref:myelomonocytic growth factor-like isoform X1 n=2 Tax=Polypterus senegalus TaxID=55291 RepID=UPI0019641F92|nr:myelomonocytic growth factor-like isoform X1 [Polypterus senegalus]